MVDLTANRFFETPLIRQSFAGDFAALAAAVTSAVPADEQEPAWHAIDDRAIGPEGAGWLEAMLALAERFSADANGRPPRHRWGVSLAGRVIRAGAAASSWDVGAYWSAILRVSGDSGQGGALIVEDPRMPMRAMHEPGVAFKAPDGQPDDEARIMVALAPGETVLFPGWMRCGVAHYRGGAPIVELGLSLAASLAAPAAA